MDDFRGLLVETPLGSVSMSLRPSTQAEPGSALVLLHGLGRDRRAFAPIRRELENLAPLILCELPGHGLAPPEPTSNLATLAARTKSALQSAVGHRKLYFVGESLGALLALALAPMGHGVVAIEPPLRPAEAWPLAEYWRLGLMSTMPSDMLALLGLGAPAIDYMGLLDAAPRPVEVVVGAEPLGQRRYFETTPSLVGHETRALIPDRAQLTVAQGGHHLLGSAPEACVEAVGRMLRGHYSRLAGDTGMLGAET